MLDSADGQGTVGGAGDAGGGDWRDVDRALRRLARSIPRSTSTRSRITPAICAAPPALPPFSQVENTPVVSVSTPKVATVP